MESEYRVALSEAGNYSYCALIALTLHKLFPDESEKKFKVESVKNFCRHLKSEVKPVMIALALGEINGDFEPYLKILKDEPAIENQLSWFVKDLISFAVQGGQYDARIRVCIHHISKKLAVPNTVIDKFERTLVQCLSQEKVESSSVEDEKAVKRDRTKKIKRYVMIGIATVGGGAVLGLTGGLAAPLVAAGAGAIIGGAGAAALGSAAGVAVISSIMGLAGAGLTGYKMKKRLGEIEEFAFEELTKGQELHVTIAISGWITDSNCSEAVMYPWLALKNSREQYVLRYESKYLLDLGTAIDYLYSFAVSMAAQEALKYTVLSGLIAAIAWPAALISVAGVIDNPWGVCQRRSAQVGRHLAEVLLQRQQGHRPVTLIGFSLGARVIYYCLKELSNREACEGIVENAILLGAPVPAHVADWSSFKKVVAGKIVNGYCSGDWLLKFVYRTSSATLNIAGLQPIQWNDRRMQNLDLSNVISGHMDYYDKIDLILEFVGLRSKSPELCFTRDNSTITSATKKIRSQSAPVLSDIEKDTAGIGTLSTIRSSETLESSSSRLEISASSSPHSSARNLNSDFGLTLSQTSTFSSFSSASQKTMTAISTSSGIEDDITFRDLSNIQEELQSITDGQTLSSPKASRRSSF